MWTAGSTVFRPTIRRPAASCRSLGSPNGARARESLAGSRRSPAVRAPLPPARPTLTPCARGMRTRTQRRAGTAAPTVPPRFCDPSGCSLGVVVSGPLAAPGTWCHACCRVVVASLQARETGQAEQPDKTDQTGLVAVVVVLGGVGFLGVHLTDGRRERQPGGEHGCRNCLADELQFRFFRRSTTGSHRIPGQPGSPTHPEG